MTHSTPAQPGQPMPLPAHPTGKPTKAPRTREVYLAPASGYYQRIYCSFTTNGRRKAYILTPASLQRVAKLLRFCTPDYVGIEPYGPTVIYRFTGGVSQ